MKSKLIIALLMLTALPALATTNYVDGQSGSDTNSGTAWTNSFQTLTNALAMAGSSDEIWVAAGSYSPGGLTNSSFMMKSYVSIYGGFTNGGSMSDRNWTNNETILDGSNVNYHIVQAINVTNCLLDGFTIRRGNAAGPTAGYLYNGAGMLIIGGSPRVYNCLFTNNVASNGSDGRGAAIAAYSVTNPAAVISNCLFVLNTSRMGGGAVWIVGSTYYPTFKRCTFLRNSTIYYGGAVFAYYGSFENCDFISNSASFASGSGGAILVGWGTTVVNVANCTFRQNSAANGGAVMSYQGGKVNIRNCSFYTNMENGGSTAGALYANNAGSASTIWATNCILWSDSIPEAKTLGSTLTIGYSAVGGAGYAGTGNLTNVNPQYTSATDLHLKSLYGRLSSTGWVVDAVSSPCIDAGHPTMDYSQETYFNGRRINMGAYGNTLEASKSQPPPRGTVFTIH